MIRYSILVDGRVQGVGFRFFTQLTAVNLKLTGWCRNLHDGRVQIEVQGLEETLNQFISTLKKGNNFSRIDEMVVDKIPVIENEKKYSIKY
ncbi:MAG: acylphosphatase [Clostridium sp.]